MSTKINWAGLEKIGGERILVALSLALRGKSVQEIARETEIPSSSLQSTRKNGPYAHRKRSRPITESARA
jgi:hypothetical protein